MIAWRAENIREFLDKVTRIFYYAYSLSGVSRNAPCFFGSCLEVRRFPYDSL
jgi:hypothetical protein